jgi:hypothetical protein
MYGTINRRTVADTQPAVHEPGFVAFLARPEHTPVSAASMKSAMADGQQRHKSQNTRESPIAHHGGAQIGQFSGVDKW